MRLLIVMAGLAAAAAGHSGDDANSASTKKSTSKSARYNPKEFKLDQKAAFKSKESKGGYSVDKPVKEFGADDVARGVMSKIDAKKKIVELETKDGTVIIRVPSKFQIRETVESKAKTGSFAELAKLKGLKTLVISSAGVPMMFLAVTKNEVIK